MSISVTTCCFDGYIIGGQPRDIRERKHAGCGHSSQILTYMTKIETAVTYLQRIPIEGKFGQGKNGYIRNMCIRLARTEKCTIEVIIRGMYILAIAFVRQGKQKRDVVDSP